MSQDIVQPYDRFFRKAMSDLRVASEFFDAHLPLKVKELFDWSTLTLCQESFIDDSLKTSAADVLYSASLKAAAQEETSGYFYVLVEHQSTAQDDMPLRLLGYLVRILERHVRKHGIKVNDEVLLPVVYPLVFYNGETPYYKSMRFLDLFGAQQDLMQEILTHPFTLIDATQLTDAVLKERFWSGIVEFTLIQVRRRHEKAGLKRLLEQLAKAELQDGYHLVMSMIHFYMKVAGDEDPAEFIQLINQHFSKQVGAEAMTIAEQLEQRGLEKGLQQGRQEGIQQGLQKAEYEKKQIALNMLKKEIPIATIAEVTSLPLSVIEELNGTFMH